MTNFELQKLYEQSSRRADELQAKYFVTGLTRSELREYRQVVKRIGVVAHESWLAAGRPSGSEFDVLRLPPLDLSNRRVGGLH